MKFNFEIFKKTKEKAKDVKDWYLNLDNLFEEKATGLFEKMEDGFKNFGEKIKNIDYKKYKNLVTTGAFIIGTLMPSGNKEITKTTNTDLGEEKTEAFNQIAEDIKTKPIEEIDYIVEKIKERADLGVESGSSEGKKIKDFDKDVFEFGNYKKEIAPNLEIRTNYQNQKIVYRLVYKYNGKSYDLAIVNNKLKIDDKNAEPGIEKEPTEEDIKSFLSMYDQEELNAEIEKINLDKNYPNWGN